MPLEAAMISAATMALAKPDYRLELIGHDDSVLSDPQSLTLSQERAKERRDLL